MANSAKTKAEAFVVDFCDGFEEKDKKKAKSLQDAFIKYKKKRQVGWFYLLFQMSVDAAEIHPMH